MKYFSDRLMNRLPKERAYSVGISSRDVKTIRLTDDVKQDILASLNSDNATDVGHGFFFVEQLLEPGNDPQFDNELLNIALRLHETLDETKAWGIKAHCISMIYVLGQKLDNYRDLILRDLRDSDPMVRRKALVAYHTYAKTKEFEPLEHFANDDYVTEVGMGSYLIYDLRNLALETIEKVIGRKFRKYEKAGTYKNGVMAYWWDWEPFHKWKKSFWRKLQP